MSKRTIQKYMKPVRPKQARGQTWKIFLHNHAGLDLGLRFLAGEGSLLSSIVRLLHDRIEVAKGGSM